VASLDTPKCAAPIETNQYVVRSNDDDFLAKCQADRGRRLRLVTGSVSALIEY